MFGLAMGACAAICLAISYIFSGMAVRHHADIGAIGILARAHLVMGGLSLLGLPFVWSEIVFRNLSGYFWPLFGAVAFYLVGQLGLFLAQRRVDASRVVPLLGLKLLFLAVINAFILRNATYGCAQWLAVAMTIASAFILNKTGRAIPLVSFVWIAITCIGYSLSDTCIAELNHRIKNLGVEGAVQPCVLAAFLSYILAALLCLVPMFFMKRQGLGAWKEVAPFGFFWLVAMLFLYICFGEIGTVNGNIVQSTRGLIAIVLGAILAHLGFTELEEKVSTSLFVRRLIAGLLMLLSIVCFNWEKL